MDLLIALVSLLGIFRSYGSDQIFCLSIFVLSFFNFYVISSADRMTRILKAGTGLAILLSIFFIIFGDKDLKNCTKFSDRVRCESDTGFLLLIFVGVGITLLIFAFVLQKVKPFVKGKRVWILAAATLILSFADYHYLNIFDYLNKSSSMSTVRNDPVLYDNFPRKLEQQIDLEKRPLGADDSYIVAAKKAVELCGPFIALEQYEYKVFESDDIQIPHLQKYIFTPGDCYDKSLTHKGISKRAFDFIWMDYNSETKVIGEPYLRILRPYEVQTIHPMDTSKWKISAEEAMKIALQNGGQNLLDQGLNFRKFTLFNNVWEIQFILYAKPPTYGGFWANYFVDAETGKLAKDEHDNRNDHRIPLL
ncbi:MAG: PepSY domain-containing protein [Candidatus Paceibacterota bacterium]